MNIQNNLVTDIKGIINQYNVGQGKCVNPTSGKQVSLIDTDIIPFVEALSENFVRADLAYRYWKDSNYGNLDENIRLYAGHGYLGVNHYRSVHGDKKTADTGVLTPLTNAISNQTSDVQEWQYLQIRFGSRKFCAEFVDYLFQDVSKMKLADLQAFVGEIQEMVLNSEERAVIAEMKAKETKELERFNALIAFGFEDIKPTAKGFVAQLEAGLVKGKGIAKVLEESNFIPTANSFDMATGKLTIGFAEKTTTNEEPLA